MSSQVIGPPPKSLLVDRELYLWLSRVYAVLNGQDSSYEMSGDMLSGGMSQQALALAGTAEQSAESARLLSPPLPQVTRGMIQDAQLQRPVSPQVTPQQIQDAKLMAMRGSIITNPFRSISASAAHYVKPGEFVDVDATSGPITVTLPDSASNPGRICGVSKNDASGNAVTVSGSINGAASAVIAVQYTALLFVSVGTEWRVW